MESSEINLEPNSEKKVFTYVDYKNKNSVIFEYMGYDILEADKAFEEKTGIDPVKNSYVGVKFLRQTNKFGEREQQS